MNGRSVIGNALRKKHFYKEAIKVEVMPSNGKVNPEEPVFRDWLKWDPISSGEGDLLLDDIEKSFSASGSVYNTVKAVGFASALNRLPSHGLQIKEILSTVESAPETHNNGKKLSDTDKTKVTVPVYGISEELLEHRHQRPSHQDSEASMVPTSSANDSTLVEQEINHVVAATELKISKELDASLLVSDRECDNVHPQSFLDNCDELVPQPDHMTNCHSASDADTPRTCHAITDAEIFFHPKDALSAVHGEESKMPISSTVVWSAESVSVERDIIGTDQDNETKPAFVVSDTFSKEGFRESNQFQEKIENLANFANEILNQEFHGPVEKENGFLVSEVEPVQKDVTSEPMQEDMMEERKKLNDQVAIRCQIPSKSASGITRIYY